MSMDAAAVSGWAKKFGELCRRVETCFGRKDLRRRASGVCPRFAGSPGSQEHVAVGGVSRRRDATRFAAALGPGGLERRHRSRRAGRLCPLEHLLARDEPGLLVVDETGFLKKGLKSAGNASMRSSPTKPSANGSGTASAMARKARDSTHHPLDARDGLPRHHPNRSGRRREGGHDTKKGEGLIPLSAPEVRRLFLAVLTATEHDLPRLLDWSTWRRRHQATARNCHYQARAP